MKGKYVYVCTHEHYHFPPNGSDMVAARPERVYPGTKEGRVAAMRYVNGQAELHQQRARAGEVKAHGGAERPADEYRVWVDFDAETHKTNVFADKFCWVVRLTPLMEAK